MLLKNPTKSLTIPNNFRAHNANKIPIKRGKYVGVLNTGTKIKNHVLINEYLILFLGQPKKQAFRIHSNPILLQIHWGTD